MNYLSPHFSVGMPTLIECPDFEQSLNLCCELGLDFIEINMNLPEYQIDNLERINFNKLLAKSGKYITIHLEENFNICDFNKSVVEACLLTALRTIDVAKRTNIPIINMHMAEGVYFSLPDKEVFLFEKHSDDYLEKLGVFRDACDNAIGNHKIMVCIENCGKYHEFQ